MSQTDARRARSDVAGPRGNGGDDDRPRDAFVTTLAHELRNALASLRTGLELIRLAGDGLGTVERVRPMMERQVDHMGQLLDGLIDLTSLDAGQVVLARAPASLDALVTCAGAACRGVLVDREVGLTLDLPPGLFVDVDAGRVVRVLSLLFQELAHPLGPGDQVRVRARALTPPRAPAIVELRLTAATSRGASPPRRLPADASEAPADAATPSRSIGAALARRLVELHGGELRQQDGGTDGGAALVMTLPAAVAAPAPALAAPPASARRGRRVLVVDDNRDAADTLAMLVWELGGDARVAYSGAAAVAALDSFDPELVLLDLDMPGVDGYETCRRLRDVLSRSVMVIALSGMDGLDGDEPTRRAGFDARIVKPAAPAVLGRLVSRHGTLGLS